MAKKSKAKAPKSVAAKDLEPKDVQDVKGARKAGEKPVEYLKVEMENVLVSNYQL